MEQTLDTGNTAFVLLCGALVLLMTPGLAFFYGGLERGKNVLNTMMMSLIAMGVIAIEWAVLGYSLSFAEGNAVLGGLGFFGLEGVGAAPQAGSTIPHLAFMGFQMMFAVITPALISGAVVGRMRFGAYVAFIAVWGLVVYAPLCHMVWGGGWLGSHGALDFAGGTVVHVSAGVSALVAARMVGRRGLRHPAKPHNVPFVLLGAGLLWFGWFGFNAGSALAADGVAALAFVTTNLAAAGAVVGWCLLETLRFGRPTAIGAATGAVVGLVVITPAAGFVSPMAAILMGLMGAGCSFAAIQWMKKTAIDDALDVFACHGVGGMVGALLTGVFASAALNPAGADGLLAGNASLVGVQALGVLVAAALAALGTAGILRAIDAFVPIRADEEAEALGLDLAAHGESAYEAAAVYAGRVEPEAPESTPVHHPVSQPG